jgi:membrane protein required for colicin V production
LIDIIFAILIVIAIIKGYQKGLIIAVFSIIAFIVGLAAALKLSATVAAYLQNNVNISGKWLPIISFTVVFLIVVLIVNLGAKLIEKSFEMALPGWVNRMGGIFFFILLYVIILSVFLFYAEKIHLFEEATILTSKAYPFVKPWGPKVIDSFGKVVPVFKDMFARLGDYFESISTKIPH